MRHAGGDGGGSAAKICTASRNIGARRGGTRASAAQFKKRYSADAGRDGGNSF